MMLQFIQQLNGQNFYCEPIFLSLSLSLSSTLLILKSDYYGDTFFKSAGTECVDFFLFDFV
jgi:hypothetical protein